MIGKRLIWAAAEASRPPWKRRGAAPGPPREAAGRRAGQPRRWRKSFARPPGTPGPPAMGRPPPSDRRPLPAVYFSAPAVSPATTCRWKTMYAASTGSIAMVSPANSPDQSPL